MICDGRSNEGTNCERELGHVGYHEGIRNEDLARWWEPELGIYEKDQLGAWRPCSGSVLRVPLKDGRIAVVEADPI